MIKGEDGSITFSREEMNALKKDVRAIARRVNNIHIEGMIIPPGSEDSVLSDIRARALLFLIRLS